MVIGLCLGAVAVDSQNVASEVVIVGDATRRSGLLRAVVALGYDASILDARELNRRVRSSEAMRALLLCTADLDAGLVLAGLRRTRLGAAIPVILVGRLGGDLGSLAEVLDLGADHFVEEPVDLATLAQALREFAGPVGGGDEQDERTREVGQDWPRRQGQPAPPEPSGSHDDEVFAEGRRGHIGAQPTSRSERSTRSGEASEILGRGAGSDRMAQESSEGFVVRSAKAEAARTEEELASRSGTRHRSSTGGTQRLSPAAAPTDRGLEWTTPVARSGRPERPGRQERIPSAPRLERDGAYEPQQRREPTPRRAAPGEPRTGTASAGVAGRANPREEVSDSLSTHTRSAADDSGDPALGQLHRTLDRLEARLRARGGQESAGEGDEHEISAIDLDPYDDPERGPRNERARQQTGLIERDGRSAAPQAEFEDEDSAAGFRAPGLLGRRESARLTALNLDADTVERDQRDFGRSAQEREGAREAPSRSPWNIAPSNSSPSDDVDHERTDPRPVGLRAVAPSDDGEHTEIEYFSGEDRDPDAEASRRLAEREAEFAARQVDAPSQRPRGLRAVPEGDDAREQLGLGSQLRIASGPASPAGASGTLTEQSLPQLLWTLYHDEFTGALELAHGRAEKVLWFRSGALHFVQSSAEGDRFVDGLVSRGVLTPAQWDTARRLANKETRRAGKLLIEAGFLKPRELSEQIERHLEDCVARCLLWHDARWRTRPGDHRDEPIGVRATVPELIVRACLDYLDPGRAGAWMSSQRPCPRLVGYGRDGLAVHRTWSLVTGGREGTRAQRVGVSLSSKGCEELLRALDGRRTLDELGATPSWDAQTVYGFVYALWVIGELEWVDAAGRAPTMDPASVDSERITDRLRIAREGDYFQLLGLSRDAVGSEIRRAHGLLRGTFEDQSLELRTLSDRAREIAELRDALDEARDILVDDALRSAYLAHLVDPEPPPAGSEGAGERRRGGRLGETRPSTP